MTHVQRTFSFNYGLMEMSNTRGSGQGSRDENPQMTELRDLVQMLVGVVTAQQELLQQYFQPPQPQETREVDSSRWKTQ